MVLSHSVATLQSAVGAFAAGRMQGYTEICPLLLTARRGDYIDPLSLSRPASALPPTLPTAPPFDPSALAGFPQDPSGSYRWSARVHRGSRRVVSALRHADAVCYIDSPLALTVKTYLKASLAVCALERVRTLNPHATLVYPAPSEWTSTVRRIAEGDRSRTPWKTDQQQVAKGVEVDRYLDFNSHNLLRELTKLEDLAPTMTSLQALRGILSIPGHTVLSAGLDGRPTRAEDIQVRAGHPAWTRFIAWLVATGMALPRDSDPRPVTEQGNRGSVILTDLARDFPSAYVTDVPARTYFNKLRHWRSEGLTTARQDIDAFLFDFARRQKAFARRSRWTETRAA